jgi:hypothetical protein
VNRRRLPRWLALIALTMVAPASRVAHAEVIVDDSVTDATPDQAAVELSWCATMPGCTAIWHEGGPAVVILDYAIPDIGGVGSPAPSSEFDQQPSEPSPASPDVDDSVPDPGTP